MFTKRRIAGLSLVLTAAVLAAACSSTEDSEAEATTTTAAPTTTAPTTAAPTQPIEAGITDPSELLLTLAQTWDDADWEKMGSFANSNVVEVAKEWRDANGFVNITPENIDVILETCFVPGAGVTMCEFVYAPPEGFGLIFNSTYESTDAGLRITDLQFGGDTG